MLPDVGNQFMAAVENFIAAIMAIFATLLPQLQAIWQQLGLGSLFSIALVLVVPAVAALARGAPCMLT